jgi:hypothetical protein
MQQASAFAIPFILIGLILLTTLPIGLSILIRGLRGRMLDDHPVCRRCGFDLFGLPAGVEKCSECGADLARPKAIRVGNRRRRAPLIWTGGFIFLIGFAVAALIGVAALQNVNWIEYEPTWYVIRDSQSSVPSDRDPALKELLRRLNGGELSDERVKDLVAKQLVWQNDANTPWAVERGDLIDAAHAADKMPADQWANYLARAVEFKLYARPQIRRGDAVPVQISQRADRSGSRMQINLFTEVSLLPSDLAAAKQNFDGGRNGSSGISRGGMSTVGHQILLDPKLIAAAPDGTQNLHIKLKADLYDHPAGDGSTPPTATKTITLDTTWDLVAADAPTIKPIDDPSVKAAVEKAITINRISVNSRTGDSGYVNMSINFNNSPVPLACKIILRSGDREWDAGHIYVQKNVNSGWGTGGMVKNFDAKTVDVILRPDPRIALDTIDMHEYWTGEAIIKNVPVTPSGQ